MIICVIMLLKNEIRSNITMHKTNNEGGQP